MKPPYWKCRKCNIVIKKAKFPINEQTRVPVCPKCLDWQAVDILIGDTSDKLGRGSDLAHLRGDVPIFSRGDGK